MKKNPTATDQLELMSIDRDFGDTISIPRTIDTYNIRWIKPITLEKLSILELNDGIDVASDDTPSNVKKRAKFLSKAASYIILNGFKIVLFHWLFWRYLYYIKGYGAEQLLPIIQTAKKKAQQLESYLASVLVAQMKITNPTLTKEEVEHIQSELTLALNQQSEKNMSGS